MNNFVFNDIKSAFRTGNYLYQVLIVNAAIFLILNIVLAFTSPAIDIRVLRFIGLQGGLKDSLLHFWGYFTYMFVHKGFFHFLFNMLWVYWIGRILADLYGQTRFGQVYIIGGLFGGLLFVLSSMLLPGVPPHSFLIGASGSVLAVIVATAMLAPDYSLYLFFFGRVPLKYLALAAFVLTTLIDLNLNTGGKIAHIGGAAYGLLYGYYLPRGKDINRPFVKLFDLLADMLPGRGKSRLKTVYKSPVYKTGSGFSKTKRKYSRMEITEIILKVKKARPGRSAMKDYLQLMADVEYIHPADRQLITDHILEKIARSGYDSLMTEEKDFLFKSGKQ